jgi:hypothetical protein
MKIYLLTVLVLLTSCASTQKLKESTSCQVWEEQSFLGPRSVVVEENQSNWKGNCSLFFVWWCDWVKADMPEGQEGIFLEGNGLFNQRKLTSRFKDETMIYESTFLDGLIKSSPLTIDRKNLRTKRTISTAVSNIKADEEFQFNDSCTSKQVAIGSVALIAIKNRK